MRLWRFTDPRDYTYAEAGRRGFFRDYTAEAGRLGARTGGTGSVCSECGASAERLRAKPLILAWEPGSALIGDFTWPGLGFEVVVTEDVCAVLESSFAWFERGPIEMVDLPSRKGTPRVRLPYEGPALYELWTTAWASADVERSTIRLKRRCGTCGTEAWHIDGGEHWDSTWDARKKELVRTRIGRDPESGIYVSRAELGDADIFRVVQCPAWVFCTDGVRELVRERRFTNVDFLEMGETTERLAKRSS